MCVPKDLWKPAPGKLTGEEARASALATRRAAYRGGTQTGHNTQTHTDLVPTVATNQSDRGTGRDPHRARERTRHSTRFHLSRSPDSRTRWVGGCEKK